DVEDGAAQDPDELSLRMRRLLEMQAAQRAGRGGEREVVLDEGAVEAGGGEVAGVVPLGEIAPRIPEPPGLIDLDLGKPGRGHFHPAVPRVLEKRGIFACARPKIQKMDQ